MRKNFVFHTQRPEGKKWVKKLNSKGRLSVVKWSLIRPHTFRWSRVRILLKHGFTMDDVYSLWCEAVIWSHLQPRATWKKLRDMIPWRFDHIIREEIKRAIDREENEILYFDFSGFSERCL